MFFGFFCRFFDCETIFFCIRFHWNYWQTLRNINRLMFLLLMNIFFSINWWISLGDLQCSHTKLMFLVLPLRLALDRWVDFKYLKSRTYGMLRGDVWSDDFLQISINFAGTAFPINCLPSDVVFVILESMSHIQDQLTCAMLLIVWSILSIHWIAKQSNASQGIVFSFGLKSRKINRKWIKTN